MPTVFHMLGRLVIKIGTEFIIEGQNYICQKKSYIAVYYICIGIYLNNKSALAISQLQKFIGTL